MGSCEDSPKDQQRDRGLGPCGALLQEQTRRAQQSKDPVSTGNKRVVGSSLTEIWFIFLYVILWFILLCSIL